MKMTVFKSAAAALMFMSAVSACAREKGFRSVSADEFEKVISDTSVIVVDVRTASEFAASHIPQAKYNIDVLKDDFAGEAYRLLPEDRTIAVYCRSGRRSKNAAAVLAEKGYDVVELDSGFIGWTDAGKATD